MIVTNNLLLIPCDQEILEFALAGNDYLSRHLEIQVPEKWTEFGLRPIKYALNQLKLNTNESGWWTYFPISKMDNKLIGTCGFKGKPNEFGIVEIGYEIIESYRNKGLATELVIGLTNYAFSFDSVLAIQAHTIGETNGSTRVLSKCGFIKKKEFFDKEHGTIWQWELARKPIQ